MKSLWLENGQLSLRSDVPVPTPPAGEALVKVRLAGICGTDLEMVKGYYPFQGIPGHEFVGVISECPSHPHRVGERVVGEIHASCDTCSYCLRGLRSHCPNRTVLGIAGRNGAFAEYLLLPERNLIALPDEVTDRAAVFTEPLAAALEILQQLQVRPEDRVLLIGAGRLGQLIAQVLSLHGCPLFVLTRYRAQQRVLHDFGIDALEEDQAPRGGWDIVIEATGSKEGLTRALGLVRPRGTIVLKSTYKGTSEVDCSKIVVNEIRLIGSRCGPFRPAVEMLRHHRIRTETLIAETLPLVQAEKAFRLSEQPGILKVLLNIG